MGTSPSEACDRGTLQSPCGAPSGGGAQQMRGSCRPGTRSPVPSVLSVSRAIVRSVCSLAATPPLLLPEEGDLACGTVPQPFVLKATLIRPEGLGKLETTGRRAEASQSSRSEACCPGAFRSAACWLFLLHFCKARECSSEMRVPICGRAKGGRPWVHAICCYTG